MNPIQAHQILAARAEFTGTDVEFIAAANAAPTPTYRQAWVTANTIRASQAMGGPTAATAIYNALIAGGVPDQAATFASVGFDMGTEASRAGVEQMYGVGIITFDQARAIVAPALVPQQTWAQAWGVDVLTAEVMSAAADMVAGDKVRDTVNNNFNAACQFIADNGAADVATIKAILVNGL